MMADYDVIVVGCGAMGAATTLSLARRGVKVLCIEQFDIGHSQGSSHGESRIIRQAYFEHPDYVPLLKSSYSLWNAIETETNARFFHRVGLVIYGEASSVILEGVRTSARLYQIPVENLTGSTRDPRFAPFRPAKSMIGIFEPGAGYLEPELAIAAMVKLATDLGAEFRTRTVMNSFISDQKCVSVDSSSGAFQSKKIILTSGAWSSHVLTDLKLPIRIHRMPVGWYASQWSMDESHGIPCFAFHTEGRFIYGFPSRGDGATKIADHTRGEELSHPRFLTKDIHEEEFAPVRKVIREFLPDVKPQLVKTSTCMYSMTPDEHFILDIHPKNSRVVIGAGFSGHGFKFAPVVGEICADLSLKGKSEHPCAYLQFNRFCQTVDVPS